MRKILILFIVLLLVIPAVYCQDTTESYPTIRLGLPNQYAQFQSIGGYASVHFIVTPSSGYMQNNTVTLHLSCYGYSEDRIIPLDYVWNISLSQYYSWYITGTIIILGQSYPATSETRNFEIVDNNPPSTPTNFSISVFYTADNGYPKIQWDQNGELDVRQNTQDGYIVERKLNNGSFSQITTVSGTTTSFIDYSINYASLYSGNHSASYRIKAKDVNGNLSTYTNIKTLLYGNAWKLKPKGETNISEYKLHQNYPNPFNPSTVIEYSVKEPGLVKLEVYNILGDKVRELVNEVKGAGVYTAVFDAVNLPSGIYICKINVNDFSAIQKMSLLK